MKHFDPIGMLAVWFPVSTAFGRAIIAEISNTPSLSAGEIILALIGVVALLIKNHYSREQKRLEIEMARESNSLQLRDSQTEVRALRVELEVYRKLFEKTHSTGENDGATAKDHELPSATGDSGVDRSGPALPVAPQTGIRCDDDVERTEQA